MIDFKEGVVCYADDEQWLANDDTKYGLVNSASDRCYSFYGMVGFSKNFQINEPREGWYIPKSELDTEEKYNQAVEVFGLFGFLRSSEYARRYDDFMHVDVEVALACSDSLLMGVGADSSKLITKCTFDQLMAIGELKRRMIECELVAANKAQLEEWGSYGGKESTIKYNPDTMVIKDDGLVIAKPKRRNKSKQAYDILKGLDYEYDLVKQQWYKKQYI